MRAKVILAGKIDAQDRVERCRREQGRARGDRSRRRQRRVARGASRRRASFRKRRLLPRRLKATLAANSSLLASGKLGDLKRRLLFLLGALIVFRIGAHIPVPGIDPAQLAELFKSQRGGILDMFNMFSGGALSRFSIFALGHHAVHFGVDHHAVDDGGVAHARSPEERRRSRAGARSRSTRAMARSASRSSSRWASRSRSKSQRGLVLDPGLLFRLTAVVTLTTGTHVPDVARRADHRARHRQRHFADHFRRHCGRLPAGDRRHARAGAHRARSRFRSCCSSSRRSCSLPAFVVLRRARASARYWSITRSDRSGARSMAARRRTCRSS